MRADRLISILLLLQVHRRIKSQELARRLEVSERTIHRDMEALSSAGIPVMAERGSGGGWSLLEEYRTNLTGLTEEEIRALFLVKPERLLTDLGLHQASEAALIKLLAALPAMHRGNAAHMEQRIYIDPAGWHSPDEAVPTLPVLQQATWQERKVCITYERGNATVERVVDPLGLVAKGSIWYLVASVEGEIRTYRVSRIQEAKVSDQPAIRPIDFDLASHWTQSTVNFKARLPRYPVIVRIAPEALPHLHSMGRFIQVERIAEPDEEGWMLYRLQFEIKEASYGHLFSLGSQVEIIEPPELREDFVAGAKRIVAFYTGREARAYRQ